MAAWTTIPDSDVDPESPITTSLMQALRDNPVAITENASGAPGFDVIAEQTGGAGVTVDGVLLKNSGIKTDTGGTNEIFRTKIIEIGNWNMNADNTATISHGLTDTKIRNAHTFIREDAASGNRVFELSGTDNAVDDTGHGGYTQVDGSGNIFLVRRAGGRFASTQFDQVSGYNRGWVTILYAL